MTFSSQVPQDKYLKHQSPVWKANFMQEQGRRSDTIADNDYLSRDTANV